MNLVNRSMWSDQMIYNRLHIVLLKEHHQFLIVPLEEIWSKKTKKKAHFKPFPLAIPDLVKERLVVKKLI